MSNQDIHHEPTLIVKQPPKITNDQFLQVIFGDLYQQAHVTSFSQDPGSIPPGESGRCWAGGAYKDKQLMPDSNQFYTVSLFTPDENGKANRRKKNFSACHVIALDDVKEKLPLEQVMRLPPPSIVLKSSLYSEQWLYLLSTPCSDANRIDNLHDGLISQGLAPDGKDPGQKGVSRFLRLPEGRNTKAKRVAENSGTPPRCEVTQWHPERRYTLEKLAEPFGVDLDAARADKSVDGAAHIPDHPLLNTDGLQIKSIRSSGRFDVTCPWIEEHTGADDNGAAVFTNSDGSIGFKCHHGSCESRTGGELLNMIESLTPGFNERLRHWQAVREFGSVATEQVTEPRPEQTSPLSRLLSMVADGEEMMKQMSEDRFVLKDIAIRGQWTVFYAGPNTGKTLLTQWLLRESITLGEIDGSDVFYLNVDDAAKPGAEKAIMAKEFGYHMLLSSVKGFKAGDVLSLMNDLISSGEARDKVFILDTLKKFTDLMDKRLSSSFGNVAREFVAAGGTLICAAHVNKHPGIDGKSIYAGTSDIRDDADSAFTIEHLGSSESFGQTTHTVEFECTKSRGDVAQSVTFQYTKVKDTNYRTMFNSVKRLDGNDAAAASQAASESNRQRDDAAAIEQIKTAITNGERTKGGIERFVTSTSDTSVRRVRSVLKTYTGRLWNEEKGSNNASLFSINSPPMAEVSFL